MKITPFAVLTHTSLYSRKTAITEKTDNLRSRSRPIVFSCNFCVENFLYPCLGLNPQISPLPTPHFPNKFHPAVQGNWLVLLCTARQRQRKYKNVVAKPVKDCTGKDWVHAVDVSLYITRLAPAETSQSFKLLDTRITCRVRYGCVRVVHLSRERTPIISHYYSRWSLCAVQPAYPTLPLCFYEDALYNSWVVTSSWQTSWPTLGLSTHKELVLARPTDTGDKLTLRGVCCNTGVELTI